ncbi:MAG: CDP-alcohol phosphatidyltransferase family protein [Flavobacteriales bacterium]|nr:CDP-alcohol phosphatidyltransferase family protein [Flavobacteriales bacterium]
MRIPSTYALKPAFQRLLNPVVALLRRVGVTPNGLTWSALVLSGVMGWMFVQGQEQPVWFFVIVMSLLLRMILNALDGMMARSHDMATKGGAVLNELGDVVSDALVMWPLALMSGLHAGWVGLLLWLSAVNELSGVLGGWLNGERRYDGPMGKSDRTLAWGVLCLFLGFEADVSEGLPIALCVVFLCLIWSTAIRIKKTVRL